MRCCSTCAKPKEFEGGKLPNAIHIPLSQLEGARRRAGAKFEYAAHRRLLRARPAQPARPAPPLRSLGFANIYQLHGGLKAWKDAGLPLETDEGA